jgi:hypothetical protein
LTVELRGIIYQLSNKFNEWRIFNGSTTLAEEKVIRGERVHNLQFRV